MSVYNITRSNRFVTPTGAYASRSLEDRAADAPNVEDWRGSGGDPSDTGTLQAAITAAIAAGGYELRVPKRSYTVAQTLVVNGDNVLLTGMGQAGFKASIASIRAAPATKLVADPSLVGPVVQFITPAGQYLKTGGGLRNIMIDGSSKATQCLDIAGWASGEFRRLHLYGATNEMLLTRCSPNTLLASPNNVAWNEFSMVWCHALNLTTISPLGARLTGGQGSPLGNTCLNNFNSCYFKGWNNHGLVIEDADDNDFFGCDMEAQWAGTYGLVLCSSDQNSAGQPYAARYNRFWGWQQISTWARSSQTSGASSQHNTFVGYTGANNIIDPVIEPVSAGTADPATVVILGTNTSSIPGRTRVVTADTTLTAFDEVLYVNAASGAVTVTLPSPKTWGFLGTKTYKIYRTAGANAITVNPPSGITLLGGSPGVTLSTTVGTGKMFLANYSGNIWYPW